MKIIATILAGPGAEAVIADALESVRGVADGAFVFLSGCDTDATMRALPMGLDYMVESYEWPKDYGEARNHALRRAEAYGFDWALTIDIDERLNIKRDALPLDTPGINCFGIMADPPTYSKPRLIRLGVGAKWVGRYCEQLEVEGGICLLPDAGSFSELPKTPEQERARILRGIEWCESLEREGAITPHWLNHLGECHAALGNWEDARVRWHKVVGDESAPLHEQTWAHLRLAEQDLVRGRLAYARDRAADALGRDPGLIQELGTVMAVASSQLGDNQSALLWAELVRVAPLDESRGGHRMLHTSVPSCERIVEELAQKGTVFGVRGFRRPPCVLPHGQTKSEAGWFRAREAYRGDYGTLAEALTGLMSFGTHLDLGAGNGLLVEAMRDRHVSSFGIELDESAREATAVNIRPLIRYGVGVNGWKSEAGYDLVSCVEVAEHIPASEADAAVDAICASSRRWVYFSAAAPGQPGHGHVNCQPKAYWIEKFEARGFAVDHEATRELVRGIRGMQHCWWLPQNAIVFRKVT